MGVCGKLCCEIPILPVVWDENGRGDRMTWLRVVIDGKLVLLNADKVSAIASDYIQFDNGSRAFADVDMESALLEIRRMDEVGKDENDKCR